MTNRLKAERDALARLRAAMLDLMQARRFTEANDVLAIIERIEPPVSAGDVAPVAAFRHSGPARSEAVDVVPPTSAAPATYRNMAGWMDADTCTNCDRPLAQHCTTHLLPCCPGSLMHGQDEGTWTPNATGL